MAIVKKIKNKFSGNIYTREEHTKALLEMYKSFFIESDEDSFKYQLFKNAIHKLNNGIEPQKVEKWVVDMEKLFRKKL